MEAKRVIPFSPPDISEQEIQEVAEALRSGCDMVDGLIEVIFLSL
jgi:dTDP-4-amino-4,6-dideoxygalactose transaminase